MAAPQLSLGSWAFSFGPFAAAPWSFDQVLAFTAEAGYDGVEINGFRPHPHPDDYDTANKCQELMDRISSLGLGVSGYAPDFTAVPPAEVSAQAYLAVFRKCLNFCDRCGIEALRVDTVSPPVAMPMADYEVRFSRLAGAWRRAAGEAAAAGVRLVWEFEPGFWLNKPSEVLRLAESVDHANFKLLFDTSHAYMGAVVGARQTGEIETLPGGVVQYAKLLAGHIGHLHLIDSDGTLHHNETSTHAAFGTGYVDFPSVLDAIRAVVVALPWWCVDFCFNPETPTAARQAVPIVHQLMREVVG